MFRTLKKLLSGLLAVFYFTSQGVLASTTEVNFWTQRQQARLELASLKLPSIGTTLPVLAKANEATKSHPLLNLIPRSVASIQEIYPSSPNNNIETSSPLVLIQDVHLNSEAQTNIAKVLQELINHQRLGLVGVEGVFKVFDFSPFRSIPDKKITKEVVESYLNNNLLAAPSYVGIVSPTEPPLFVGIDDKHHYDANVQAYLDSRSLKENITQALTHKKAELIEAKRKNFSPALKHFDDLSGAYHQGSLGLGAYVKSLSEISPNKSPVLTPFLEAYKIESTLDFKKVEVERKTLIEDLSNLLNKNETADLVEQSLSYRMGRLGIGNYYQGLKGLCEKKGVHLARYPVFSEYIHYVLLSESLKAEKLFEAVEEWERQLTLQLTTTPEEKQTMSASRHLALTEKLVDFSLTPREWESYRSLSHSGKSLLGAFPLATYESFYEEADIRSHKMIENLLRFKLKKGAGVAMVVGGFHTPMITQILREKKIGYIVVSPKITKVETDKGSAYLSVFAQEKTPLDRLFEGKKLSINPKAQNDLAGARGFRMLVGIFARLQQVSDVLIRGIHAHVNILEQSNASKDEVSLSWQTNLGLILVGSVSLIQLIVTSNPNLWWVSFILLGAMVTGGESEKKDEKASEPRPGPAGFWKEIDDWNNLYRNGVPKGEQGHLQLGWYGADLAKGLGSIREYDFLKNVFLSLHPDLKNNLTDKKWAEEDDVRIILDFLVEKGQVGRVEQDELLELFRKHINIQGKIKQIGMLNFTDLTLANKIRQEYFQLSSQLFGAITVLVPALYETAIPVNVGDENTSKSKNNFLIREEEAFHFSYGKGFVFESERYLEYQASRESLSFVDFLEKYPEKIIEVFEEASRERVGLSSKIRMALWRARGNMKILDDLPSASMGLSPSWKLASNSFNRLMDSRQPIMQYVWEMDSLGILELLIPEYGLVKYLPSDMIPQNSSSSAGPHAFTVGSHTLFLMKTVDDYYGLKNPDYKVASSLIQNLPPGQLGLLRTAIILHDLGKRPSKSPTEADHSIVAAQEIAPSFCRRIGLNRVSTQSVVWLVRNHMLGNGYARNAETAFMEKLPLVIDQVATDPSMPTAILPLFYLISLADTLSVNPWGGRKWPAALSQLEVIYQLAQNYYTSDKERRDEILREWAEKVSLLNSEKKKKFVNENKQKIKESLTLERISSYLKEIQKVNNRNLVAPQEFEEFLGLDEKSDRGYDDFFNRYVEIYSSSYLSEKNLLEQSSLFLFLIHLEILQSRKLRVPLVYFIRQHNMGHERLYEVIVGVSGDVPGTFTALTGALSAHSFSIQKADIQTYAGNLVLDRFYGFFNSPLPTEQDELESQKKLVSNISRLLSMSEPVSMEDLCHELQISYRAYRPGGSEPTDSKFLEDTVVNGQPVSVLYLSTPDFDWLLHTIAKVKDRFRVDLTMSPIETFPLLARDFFYLSRNGRPLSEKEKKEMVDELFTVLQQQVIDLSKIRTPSPGLSIAGKTNAEKVDQLRDEWRDWLPDPIDIELKNNPEDQTVNPSEKLEVVLRNGGNKREMVLTVERQWALPDRINSLRFSISPSLFGLDSSEMMRGLLFWLKSRGFTVVNLKNDMEFHSRFIEKMNKNKKVLRLDGRNNKIINGRVNYFLSGLDLSPSEKKSEGGKFFRPERLFYNPSPPRLTYLNRGGVPGLKKMVEDYIGYIQPDSSDVKDIEDLNIQVAFIPQRSQRHEFWGEIKETYSCPFCGLLKTEPRTLIPLRNEFVLVPEEHPYIGRTGTILTREHTIPKTNKDFAESMFQTLFELGPLGYRVGYRRIGSAGKLQHQSYKVFDRQLPIESAPSEEFLHLDGVKLSRSISFPIRFITIKAKDENTLFSNLRVLEEFLDADETPYDVLLTHKQNGDWKAFVALREKRVIQNQMFPDKEFGMFESFGLIIFENKEYFDRPSLIPDMTAALRELTPSEIDFKMLLYAFKAHWVVSNYALRHNTFFQVEKGTSFYVFLLPAIGEVLKYYRMGFPGSSRSWKDHFQNGIDLAMNRLGGIYTPTRIVGIDLNGDVVEEEDGSSSPYVLQKLVSGPSVRQRLDNLLERPNPNINDSISLLEEFFRVFLSIIKAGVFDIDSNRDPLTDVKGEDKLIPYDTSHLRPLYGTVNIFGSQGYASDFEDRIIEELKNISDKYPVIGAALAKRFGFFSWNREMDKQFQQKLPLSLDQTQPQIMEPYSFKLLRPFAWSRVTALASLNLITQKLLEGLNSDDSETILISSEGLRFLAEVESLPQYPSPVNVPGIVKGLVDKDPDVRLRSARSLDNLVVAGILKEGAFKVNPSLSLKGLKADMSTVRLADAEVLMILSTRKFIKSSSKKLDISSVEAGLTAQHPETKEDSRNTLAFLIRGRLIKDHPQASRNLPGREVYADEFTKPTPHGSIEDNMKIKILIDILEGLNSIFLKTKGQAIYQLKQLVEKKILNQEREFQQLIEERYVDAFSQKYPDRNQWLLAKAYWSDLNRNPNLPKEIWNQFEEFMAFVWKGKNPGIEQMGTFFGSPTEIGNKWAEFVWSEYQTGGRVLKLSAIGIHYWGMIVSNVANFLKDAFLFKKYIPFKRPKGLPALKPIVEKDVFQTPSEGLMVKGTFVNFADPSGEWLGRTYVYKKNGKAIHVKFQKKGEDPRILVYEHDMMKFLSSKKGELKLLGEYPEALIALGKIGKGQVNIPDNVGKTSLPFDFEIENDQYTFMVYETDLDQQGRSAYSTYLNDPDLSLQEFREGMKRNDHDRMVMARELGLYDGELTGLTHTIEASRGTRYYDWMRDMQDLLGDRSISEDKGVGRIDDFIGAMLYPNFRLSGPADFSGIRFIEDIVDEREDILADRRFGYFHKLFNGDRDQIATHAKIGFLGDFNLASVLLTGTYFLHRKALNYELETESAVPTDLVKELDFQFSYSWQTFTGTEEGAPYEGGLDLDLKLMARQMAYFMSTQIVEDTLSERKAPESLYPGASVKQTFNDPRVSTVEGRWVMNPVIHTIPSRNPALRTPVPSRDLGPYYGPIPLERLIRSLYISSIGMVIGQDKRNTPTANYSGLFSIGLLGMGSSLGLSDVGGNQALFMSLLFNLPLFILVIFSFFTISFLYKKMKGLFSKLQPQEPQNESSSPDLVAILADLVTGVATQDINVLMKTSSLDLDHFGAGKGDNESKLMAHIQDEILSNRFQILLSDAIKERLLKSKKSIDPNKIDEKSIEATEFLVASIMGNFQRPGTPLIGESVYVFRLPKPNRGESGLSPDILQKYKIAVMASVIRYRSEEGKIQHIYNNDEETDRVVREALETLKRFGFSIKASPKVKSVKSYSEIERDHRTPASLVHPAGFDASGISAAASIEFDSIFLDPLRGLNLDNLFKVDRLTLTLKAA